jgi:hypothetical protein
MRIAVANTDDATGIDSVSASPQNRSKKGTATDRAVDGNQQSLFGDFPPDGNMVLFTPRERHSKSYATFYLCVFNEGDDVRAELSYPVEVTNGFFVGFSERIILIKPGEWSPSPSDNRDPDNGEMEFDIPVRRK